MILALLILLVSFYLMVLLKGYSKIVFCFILGLAPCVVLLSQLYVKNIYFIFCILIISIVHVSIFTVILMDIREREKSNV